MADSYILMSILFIIVFISIENTFPLKTFIYAASISIVGCLGNFLVNEACTYGKAGPA